MLCPSVLIDFIALTLLVGCQEKHTACKNWVMGYWDCWCDYLSGVRCRLFDIWSSWCHTHTHTRLAALCLGQPGWAGTRKAKPIWNLLKQETVSGSGISWDICKSAPRCRQITTPAPHHSVFYRLDALPAAKPTASKHWRKIQLMSLHPKTPIMSCLI